MSYNESAVSELSRWRGPCLARHVTGRKSGRRGGASRPGAGNPHSYVTCRPSARVNRNRVSAALEPAPPQDEAPAHLSARDEQTGKDERPQQCGSTDHYCWVWPPSTPDIIRNDRPQKDDESP
jgi:hypothetical protein